jgi:hypothetical protein
MTTDLRNSFAVMDSQLEQPVRAPAGLRRVLLPYILAILAYTLLFTFWQVEPVPWNVHLVSILLAVTSFVPLARWYASGMQGLPMFELICLSYALQFSVPIYTQPQQLIIFSRVVPLRWSTSYQVLLYVELGLLAMMSGYYVIRQSRVSDRMPKLDLPLIPQRRKLYLWGALVGSGLLTLLSALNWGPLASPAIGAIVRLMTSQFNVAIVLLAYMVYGTERDRRVQVALYAAVLYAFLVGLTTGMLENALMPLVLMLAVRWHATKRIPWLAIVAGFVVFGILNPAKFEYRRQVWYSGEEYGFDERLSVWGEAVEGEIEGSVQQETWGDRIRETLARFDLVHRFTYVREMTPAYIPYYRGETYSYFLYAWIPRLLWPGKPSGSEANEQLDVDYGLKYEWQDSTISIGQLPEAYANFGIIGIAVVMALQGIVFAALDAILNGPRSDGGRAIYLVIMAYFLNGIGSSAAMLFGALVQNILAGAILLRPFAVAWRSGRRTLEFEKVDSDPLGTSQGIGVEETYP